MRRRLVLSLPGAAALGAGLPLAAQTPRMARLGLLGVSPDSSPEIAWLWNPYWAELKRHGWEEGRNLVVEHAFSGQGIDRLPALAQDLVKQGVDVIRAGNSFSAVAAARATQQIPVVFFYVDNPVERGLVDALARPGRNLTGFTHNTGIDHFNKRIQVLKELVPSASRLSWLWMLPGDDTTTVSGAAIDHRNAIASVAKALGFESRFHDIRKQEDIAPALAAIAAWPADVMASAGFPLFRQARQPVVEFALRNRLPSLIDDPATIDAGGLCSYETAPSELVGMAEQCARYVDRILRGARAADLPVFQPSRFELVINMKTARAIGLGVSRSVLLRADRLIE